LTFHLLVPAVVFMVEVAEEDLAAPTATTPGLGAMEPLDAWS
jgi:hypothetical protein